MDDELDSTFDVENMKRHLTTRCVGQFVLYKPLTGSTMDDALQIANKGGPEGGAVLAECQTGGRGQDGHVWHSQDRGNIYVTFILRKPKTLKNRVGIQDLEFVGTCAVLKAVQELGVHWARLKWKNDLWCRGHKLAGALVETYPHPQGDEVDKAVFLLGIGVNVNSDVRRHSCLRRHAHNIATSVRSELGGVLVSRERLFARICHHLETCLEIDRPKLFQQMAEFQLFHEGSAVNVHDFKNYAKLYSGVINEVRDDWTCLVRDDAGRKHDLGDGVSLRPNPADTVLMVGESPSPLNDSLLALIDTSSYKVIDIGAQDEVQGDLASVSLIVLGGQVPGGSQFHTSLRKYIEEGGSLLLIGRAVQQIDKLMKDSEITVCGCSKSETSRDLIKVSFKDDSGSENWFYNYQSNAAYQISRTSGPMRVLATNEQGETIAGCCTVGKASVVVVGFDLDITYPDIKDTQNSNANTISSCSKTVFQRDKFFQQILKMVLSKDVV